MKGFLNMKKTVVLAEKPSVGRDIARVLNCTQKGNGFMEGKEYIVTWALGHLVTLADPETYDDKYKTWRIEDLPMLPKDLKLVVIKKTGKQFNAVKTQMNRPDVKEIVIATDAGREGELVARWILEKAKPQKPLKRLWISSVTDKAIQQGFSRLKDGKAYENLYRAAEARSEADWYVGMNATRALTTKHNAQLSCGRVQTPTLSIIAQREEEIRNFKPVPYYGIQAVTSKGTFTWLKGQETRSFSKEEVERIEAVLKAQKKPITIDTVKKATKKNPAPSFYDLTELQRDAHKVYGFSAKETLSIMQKLYEQHKLVTYPRTDSRHLSSDMVDTLKDRLMAVNVQEYRGIVHHALKGKLTLSKAYVDDAKVSDHHAIIPTEETPFLQKLQDRERKIYDLIVKRFVAAFYAPYSYEQTTVTASIDHNRFQLKGNRVLDQGWKAVYENEIVEGLKAVIAEGESLPLLSVKHTEGRTTPPGRFNEGTLLTAMENPRKYMKGSDQDLLEAISETGGLGTVATRADIIEKLFHTALIEETGKEITITSKGKQLLDLAPSELRSPTLTAEWEMKLEQIASGKLSKQEFMKEIKEYTKKSVHEIKQSTKKFSHDNLTGTKCPDCGNLMLEIKNRNGKMLVCQDRECGHRKNVSKKTNARCPNCHKRLELKGEGDGQLFVCVCGHKEKLSTFNQRRKKEKGGKATKRDVNQYLKTQQKDEPVNTALADALAKLKLDQ